MKKIVSALLSCILILSICPKTIALDSSATVDIERVSSIKDNAEMFLNASGYHNTIDTPIPMYNLNEEIEAMYFPLLPEGFLVSSYKDGHVIEFSPEGEPIISDNISGKLYYNGIMKYYEHTGSGELRQILTNNIIDKNNLQSTVDNAFLSCIPSIDYQAPAITYGVDPDNPVPINYVSTSSTQYYCVITAVTNFLQYYHDFMGADVYAGNVTSISKLRDYLRDNNYVKCIGGERLDWVPYRHVAMDDVEYHGLNQYFKRSDVDTLVARGTFASVSDVKVQLKTYAHPVLIDIDTIILGNSNSSRHVVLAYTYWETADTTYFIVNDSYGNNIVHICAEDLDSSFRVMYIP